MHRATALFVGLLLLGTSAAPAHAGDDDAKKKKEPLRVATLEEVHEALETFETDWKARGIPKDEIVSQRNYAMKKLAKLQHPLVIQELAKITKNRDKDLRTLAVIYLGDQQLHPHLAAQPILASMKKHKRDRGAIMTGLQSICLLNYLGARKQLIALMKHRDLAIQKTAIATVGATKDMRLLKDVVKLLGVDVDETSSQAETGKPESAAEGAKGADAPATPSSGSEGDGGGESETVDEGYSWDGVEVFVPEGEDPAKAVAAAQEKARSEAEAKARGGKSSGAGAAPATSKPSAADPGGGNSESGASAKGLGGNSNRRGGQQRGSSELVPTILVTLKQLTGVKFSEPGSIKEWVTKNTSKIRRRQRALDREEKAQKMADEKAMKAAKKAARR